ncbi:hypothetical protein LTR27_006717 [Elasticomyces elasticus]|nr:hypothetical protein LTR27_006717 [Elasticomyces elasticus]
MPIELLPMSEADIGDHVDIVRDAFANDLGSIFYPNGLNANDREHMKADTLKSMRKNKPSEQHLYIKAIDTDLPTDKQIVSTANWQIYPRHRSEEELDRAAEEAESDPVFSESANVESIKAFYGESAEKRRERFGGQPHVLLGMLAVHPDHQRRGLGAMQLKVGLAKADELGVQAYLESSPQGKGLYAKYGFEETGIMEFDARKFGKAEEMPHTLMVRPAKSQRLSDT